MNSTTQIKKLFILILVSIYTVCAMMFYQSKLYATITLNTLFTPTNVNVSYNQEVPNTFKNHLGETIDRDFDLGLNGVKLSTSIKGSEVKINREFDGSFEMTFRAYSEVNYHDNSGSDWNSGTVGTTNYADLREIIFTFKSATGQTFDVVIQSGEKWNNITPAARVRLYGSDYGKHYANDALIESDTTTKNDGGYYTRVGGTTFQNVARTGNALSSSQSKPLTFGFNQETMEVYVRHYGTVGHNANGIYRVVADLDSSTMGLKRLTSFNDYEVSMRFSDIKPNAEANVIIYDINGQSLAGTDLENTAGPKLSMGQPLRGIKNKAYNLSVPKSFDFIDGTIDFNGTVEVFNANNTQITLYKDDVVVNDNTYQAGLYFTPTQAGNYRVVYQGKDKSGVLGEKYTQTVTILDQNEAATYFINGSYQGILDNQTYAIGSGMWIYAASVFSPIHNDVLDALVTVKKNGAVYELDSAIANQNYHLKDLEAGFYEIIYHTPDYAFGNTEVFTFTVDGSKPLFVYDEMNASVHDINTPLVLPRLKATYKGTSKYATAVLYLPNGERATFTNGQTLATPGLYRIQYLVQFDKTYTYSEYLQVSHANSTAFTPNDPQVTVEANANTGSLFPGVDHGIKITTTKNDTSATYTRVINLAHLDPSTPLIEAMVLPKSLGALDFWQYRIRLTDKYDSKKYVDITVFKGSWGNAWSYIKAGANNQAQSGWENGKVLNAYNTGTPFAHSFTGENGLGTEYAKIYFNYHENAVYVDNIKRPGYAYGNQVIDLDSPENFNKNALFEGFTTGEVYLSIKFEYLQAESASMLIKSINGVNLTEEWVYDDQKPLISVDLQGYSQAPFGLVDTAYPIFLANAYDQVEGVLPVNARVYYLYQTVAQQEVPMVSGKFIPTQAGLYTIVYSAKDSANNIKEKTITVDVKSTIPGIEYTLDSSIITNGFKGESYTLPAITTSGGSGYKSVVLTVKDPENQVLSSESTILFDKTGTYRIELFITDFLGDSITDNFEIDITIKDSPIVNAILVEPYYILGESVVLPSINALDYNNSNPLLVENEIYYVYNGVSTQILNHTFTPLNIPHGSTVELQFNSRSLVTNKVTTVSKFVKVFETTVDNILLLGNYFDMTGFTTSIHPKGVELSTSTVNSATFIKSIIDSELRFELNPNKDQNNFSAFTVTLTDSLNPSIAIDVKIFKNTASGSTITKVSINGGETKDITGSFFGVTTFGFNIRYNKNNQAIMDGNTGKVINFVENTKFGEIFNGFPSSKVLISVKLEQITGPSSVVIQTIANQTFSEITSDRIRPLVMLEKPISIEGDINTAFTLPRAFVADVLSDVVSSNVTVRFGNQVVYTGDLGLENTFTPTAYGVYRVIYLAVDGAGREQQQTYMITIKDRIKPTLSFKGNTPTKGKVNQVINLPQAELSDNHTEDLRLYILVQNPNGYISLLEGDIFQFTPTQKGKYIITYYTYDEYKNYIYIQFEVEVAS